MLLQFSPRSLLSGWDQVSQGGCKHPALTGWDLLFWLSRGSSFPPTPPVPLSGWSASRPLTQGFLRPVLPEGPKVKAQAKSVSQGTLYPRLSSPSALPVGMREPVPLERGLRDSLGQPSLNLFTEAGPAPGLKLLLPPPRP